MKYIIIVSDSGIETPIVFSELLSHDEMAIRWKGRDVVSAGFCSFSPTKDGDDITVNCWGKSVSLNIVAQPTPDSEIILRHLNFQG